MYIRHLGSKAGIMLAVIGLIITLTSCPAVEDWSYSDLPNEYEIWHINTHDIALGKMDGEHVFRKTIDEYVTSFCYNTKYIGVQAVQIDPVLPYEEINIEALNPKYYLLDSAEDIVYGPYTENEYLEQLERIGIVDMCGWMATVPRPDGAK